jgi:hypothetical protein
LIEYLSDMPLGVPEEVAPGVASVEEGLGTVTASFEEGELFLANEDGFPFRLAWTGIETEDERTLALPAGEYVLKTYRVVREQDDERWHISATRPSIKSIEVRAGENTVVEIDESIRLTSNLNGDQAQMMISGEARAGLSIYRAGKRLPIDYRIVDDAGTVTASGSMRYG